MKILMQFWKGRGEPPSHKNVFFFRGISWESCPATRPRFLGDFGANEDLANLRLPWYPKQQPCFFSMDGNAEKNHVLCEDLVHHPIETTMF